MTNRGGEWDSQLQAQDITNTPAYTILEDLLASDKVSRSQVEFLKVKYQKLHEVVIKTYNNEKSLLARAKELNQTLQTERLQLEQKVVVANDTQAEIEVLQKEEKETADHVNQFSDQRNSIDFEIEELQKQEKENDVLLQEKYRADVAQMQPIITKFTTQIEEVKAEIKGNKEAWEKENEAVQEYQTKINDVNASIAALEQTKLDRRAEFNQAAAKPDKLKVTSARMQNHVKALDAEVAHLMSNIQKLESEHNHMENSRKSVVKQQFDLSCKQDMLKAAIVKREQNLADIQRGTQIENEKAEHAEQRRAEIDMESKAKKDELRRHLEAMARYHKAFEQQKKWHERLKRKRDTVQSILPPLISQYEHAQRQLTEMRAQYKKQRAMLQEIKQDEELFISQYLSQERLEEETADLLYGVEAEGKEYEEKITELAKDERILQGQINTLSAQREVIARDASRATAQHSAIKEDLKVSNLILMDLHKQTQETFVTLDRVKMQYEKMKNNRNKLANLTQSSSQALAEMKEKIRILQNEVEILRNESLARDRALAEEVRVHQAAQNTRGALRVDQNKHQVLLRQKQTEQNMQWMEIKKLNSIVNGAEKQMIRLRTDYAQAVDNRNLTGIQLIDRNDELCILYEKANIQESILRKGEEALKEKEEESAAIKKEIAEMRRKIESGRRKIPSMAVYSETTANLQRLEQELNDDRTLTARLSEKLEQTSGGSGGSSNSSNTDTTGGGKQKKTDGSGGEVQGIRCRALGGVDPEPEQLVAKIEVLEERLNDKKEQLLEKELVLDEVTSLSDKLRNQAAESRGATLTLAQKVNEYQRKIRNTTRKMMATVSELSMYQATAMKLEQQRQEQQRMLDDARQRSTRGLPPTQDSEHEWYRMERDRIRRHEAMLKRAQATSGSIGGGQSSMSAIPMTRTTAAPRPNAYIPEELGIPKPYGHLAPFKPTPLGATARHIRNPIIPDVEI